MCSPTTMTMTATTTTTTSTTATTMENPSVPLVDLIFEPNSINNNNTNNTNTISNNDTMIPTLDDFRFLMSAWIKPQRRVRFAPFVYAANSGPLVKDEVRELWYNQTDLANFKSQARKLASEMRRNNSNATTATSQSTEQQQPQQQQELVENDIDIENLRGLEHCTSERQRHRYMSIRCTLSAYRRGMGDDQTAMIARKCTAWSGEIAFVQACHDFAIVYQPSLRSLIPAVTSGPPDFPFVLKKKRSTSTESNSDSSSDSDSSSSTSSSSSERRVRQRTMVC